MSHKLLLPLLILIIILTSAFPVSAQNNSNYPVYIVQPGDTILTIASRFGVSANDIVSLNNIQNQDLISPGDSLLIPGLSGISGTLTTITAKLGESLRSISETYGVDENLITRINRITSPTEVYAGASLIIPVVDQANFLSPYQHLDSGNSFLELSAITKENPWQLLISNQIASSSNFLPGDIAYKKLINGEYALNLFDPNLTKVDISPLPLMQGQTFEISINSAKPVTLRGTLAGNSLAFFSEENDHYVALQGIYAMAQPGIYDFTLQGQYDDGTSFSISKQVLLVSGNYPEDPPLTVDPGTIDPAVTKPEEDFVENLVSPATPVKYWDGIFQRPGYFNEYNSGFGVRRSYNGSDYIYFHTGLDFAGGMGLPIVAPADGVVVFAGPLTVRGNATFIDHGWGVYSGFFHQSEIKVKVGDKVTKGQVIGLVGNTGRVNDANEYPGAGAHLHWEVWVHGVQVNPMTWMYQQFP